MLSMTPTNKRALKEHINSDRLSFFGSTNFYDAFELAFGDPLQPVGTRFSCPICGKISKLQLTRGVLCRVNCFSSADRGSRFLVIQRLSQRHTIYD
eukprot:SAG31_NODE_1035_length_10225_cov_2.372506_6_plen_96_part_00